MKTISIRGKEYIPVVERVKELLAKNPEGFTAFLDSGIEAPLTTGYCVAITDIVMEDTQYLADLLCRYDNVAFCLGIEFPLVGGWKGPNGYCVDLTIHVHQLEQALHIGSTFKQHSIWDCGNKQAIELP